MKRLPVRIVLAIGGAFVAGCIGGYTVLQWYLASRDGKDAITRDWMLAILGEET